MKIQFDTVVDTENNIELCVPMLIENGYIISVAPYHENRKYSHLLIYPNNGLLVRHTHDEIIKALAESGEKIITIGKPQ